MLRLCAEADGVFACPHQVAQRCVVDRGNVDRGEFTGAMQPCPCIATAPVRLDPIATALRHAGRSDDDALLALSRQVPVDPTPAGARLMHEAQPPVRATEGLHHLRQRLHVAGNAAVVADLTAAPLLGDRDVDRFLVDIHPHEHATFRHGLPPWVCGPARRLHQLRVTHDNHVRQVSRFRA